MFGNKETYNKNIPAYLNEELSFEERAADLVSRMTLEEKAAQLKNEAAAIPRLGVSAYNYWREGLHGVARQGKATSFPTSLSMANTWDRGLVFKAAEITATEARGKNAKTNLSYWSPTVNMARDPRWGRNEETYGEDPYLTGQLGIEFVKGMQGDDEKYIKTIATVKHFIANNVEKERRMGTSVMNEETLRDYYGRVFQNIVEGSNPASAMSSYNATTIYRNGELLYDYIPSTANPYILQDLLRRNWGFNGYVTGDCGAFDDLNKTLSYKTALFPNEKISEVPQSATITKGFLNGADTDCGIAATAQSVLEAVEKGYITENEISVNVYNLFLQRMRTGEFDKNPKYSGITSDVLEAQEHIAVAEAAAEDSWVLLKNEDNILPLSQDVTNIALVGALADEIVLGDYSGSPEHTVTPYEGIVSELKKTHPNAKLNYLGSVTDDTKLMNVGGLELILRDGNIRKIDLSKAKNVVGMEQRDGGFYNITRRASADIESVDFSEVVSVKSEIAARGLVGGKIKLYYGFGGPQVAEAQSAVTADLYAECIGEYTGESGGYCRTADLHIEFEANTEEFSAQKYKAELDAADLIIAYAGTTLSDSAEFNDRHGISLPLSQAHVLTLTKAYPQKTIVVLQTVGQIDVTEFDSGAKAILWTSYNGQTQGSAIGKVLTGQVNPSGKLTTTWYTAEDLEKMPVGVEGVKGSDGIIRYHNNYEIKSGDNFPGRTYQYYENTPVYPFGYGLSYTSFEYSNFYLSDNAVDANGKITVSVDVTNTGTCDGKEAVQFYIEYPQNCGLPKKQLKGFEKLELLPGETKTATAEIEISELRFFSEENQRVYVQPGSYRVYAAKNSVDTLQGAEFTVSGKLNSSLKTVRAIPNGVTVRGLIEESGDKLEAIDSVSANLSAVMTDEQVLDLASAEVVYTSADNDIARVDNNGTVTSGVKSGVVLITASVTAGGVTKSVSFPIVNALEIKASEADKSDAEQTVKGELNSYCRQAYSDKNMAQLETICSESIKRLWDAVKREELEKELVSALTDLRAVRPDNTQNRYTVVSENPAFVSHGVIDYRSGGIEPYIADSAGISGTVTRSEPCSGIFMAAYDGDKIVDSSKLKWQLENLGNSKRKAAVIDSDTGELTVISNGIVRIRAINTSELLCGESDIYINLQVEGEDADNGGGADLTDSKQGASGGSGANNAGTTKSYSMEFKGIRLTNLKQIRLRYSLASGKVAASFGLSKNAEPETLFAVGTLTATGSDELWNETVIEVDAKVLSRANVDDNGLATVYVRTNSASLDFFKLIYEEVNDETPYKIAALENRENGTITAHINYVGSSEPMTAQLTGSIKTRIKGGGAYEISGFTVGEEAELYVEDKDGKRLSQSVCHVYQTPKPKRVVVYSASDPAYDAMFSPNDNVKLPEINGLTGYGRMRNHQGSGAYTYKGKEYKFSRDWQGGLGSETCSCLFFMPKAPCTVTVIYNGGEKREQYIVQNSVRLAAGLSSADKKIAVSAKITDTSAPVYTYGAGSNKSVYAIIVEYSGEVESDGDVTVQSINWGSGFARLIENTASRARRIEISDTGRIWSEVDMTSFDCDTDSLRVNCLAVHKDRLYAACTDGAVLVITDCPKCRRAKKLADFDICKIEIDDNIMYLSGAEQKKEIPMSALGADQIEYDEAMALLANGAAAVDVRDAEDFLNEPSRLESAVNVPLENLELISTYSKSTRFIFCCSKGIKSAEAVFRAKEMGYENVYALI